MCWKEMNGEREGEPGHADPTAQSYSKELCVNRIPPTLLVNGAEQGWNVRDLCVIMGKSTENADDNCSHRCWVDLEGKKKSEKSLS